MLKLDLRPGESISIGGVAIITLESKTGQAAKLSIQADKSVPINRVAKDGGDANIAAKAGITRQE